MNSVLFPQLFDVSFSQEDHFWAQLTAWEDNTSLETLLDHFETEMERSGSDIDIMQLRAGAFLNDLIALRDINPQYQDLFKFLQFEAATGIIRFLMAAKLLPYLYDWLCNSIGDDVSSEQVRNCDFAFLYEFTVSNSVYIKRNLTEIFLQWTSGLFYYSKNSGGHQDLAVYYLNHYTGIVAAFVKARYSSISLADALCHISAWCEHHKKVDAQRIFCGFLHNVYDKSEDIQVKARIAFYSTLVNTAVSPLSKEEWIHLVETHYMGQLRAHDRLQLVLAKCGSDTNLIIELKDEIKESISRYHDFLNGFPGNNRATDAYELSRIYQTMHNTLAALFQSGLLSVARELISHFFKIAIDETLQGDFMVIIPNTEVGLEYVMEGNVKLNPYNPHDVLVRLREIANRFLGTAYTFDDILGTKIPVPERLGAPAIDSGNDFRQVMEEVLGLPILQQIPQLPTLLGFHLYYGESLPIQSIIARSIGLTLPLIQSFQEPLASRPIRTVFIWQGHTNLSEIESMGLKQVFEEREIAVTLVKAEEATAADFINHYRDAKYDLFWVSCHGEFKHFEPHKSYLDLGNDISIAIDELAQYQPNDNGRRLLVLDACDGATTGLFNNPASIGIGAAGVNARQSLISHAWPIDDYAGLILGILLGIHLSEGLSYAEAHTATIRKFIEGREVVHQYVAARCNNQDVLERIENTRIGFDDFYYYGSLTYII